MDINNDKNNNHYENALDKKIDNKLENKGDNQRKVPLLADTFMRTIVWFCSTIGIMMCFGFVLEYLEGIINKKLDRLISGDFVLFTAAIGTPIHELGHYLMCLLFGFKVTSVEFLRPFSYKKDGILGMVSYYHTTNTIKDQVGDFFVGIGPLVFGGIFILLVLKLLLPEAYKEADRLSDQTWLNSKNFKGIKSSFAFIGGFFKGLFSIKGFGFLRVIVAIYFITSISMHMTLSPADIENGINGLYVLIGLFFIFSFVTSLLKLNYKMDAAEVATGIIFFFMIGVISDLILLGIVEVYPYIEDFISNIHF